MADVISTIKFDGIIPGNYYSEKGFYPASLSFNADEPRKTLRSASYSDKSIKSIRRSGASVPEHLGASKSYEDKSTEDMAVPLAASASQSKKPEDIQKLEQILSLTYKAPVTITGIADLTPTRKREVREVHFLKDNSLYKVWVFKADPIKTLRELTLYYLIDQEGIPTGKPIGYKPNLEDKSYPYEIAILGGILEHAGNPYNDLIRNMNLAPDLIHSTAISVARLIADYQAKLTKAKEKFKKYGIELEKISPKKELEDRLLKALNLEEKLASDLIKACESLHNKEDSLLVVSHGDTHTGNIVTVSRLNKILGQKGTSIKDFGIIDWDSIGLDNPYSDLKDFWLHHKRTALSICPEYNLGFEDLEKAFKDQFEKDINVRKLDIPFKELHNNSLDPIIQSVLWNLYEMFDPVRKDPNDIKEKASYHYKALLKDLGVLEHTKCKQEAIEIRKELNRILKTLKIKL